MHLGEGELKNFLLDAGLVSRAQLEDAALRAHSVGLPLSKVLIESGVMGEDEVRRAAAHALGVPFVELERHLLTPEALFLVPEPIARAHGVVAFSVGEGGVEIALLDLSDLAHLEFLRPAHKLLPRLTSRESMTRALVHYQKHLKEKFGTLLEGETQSADALVLHALYSNASEVLLDHSPEGLLVRYRIHGALREAMKLSAQKGALLLAKLKTMAGLFAVAKIQEGRFKIEKDGDSIYARVQTLPTFGGERITLSLARERDGRKGYTLRTLGLHGEALEQLHATLLKRKGMVLVSGSHGAGKTTLLYTMLDMLSAPHLSIATVERAVEHRLAFVAHAEIKQDVTTAGMLRAVLKQDPDIVMVGEIPDRETAALCARAAARGVFVLAGIEAPSAAEGIVALQELGADPQELVSSLSLVVGVASVRKLCEKQFVPTKKLTRAQTNELEERADFSRVLAALKEESRVEKTRAWKDIEFTEAVPCSQCQDGFVGRTGLYEVMPITTSLRELVREGAPAKTLAAQARKEGMLTLAGDGMYKAAIGVTALSEIQ